MKYSQSLISAYLLFLQCNVNTEAFVVHNKNSVGAVMTSNHPSLITSFASTLDETSSSTSNSSSSSNNNEKKEDEQSSIAVSVNHIIVWDDETKELRIKERDESPMEDGKDNFNSYKKEIIYEEDDNNNDNDTQQQLPMSSSSLSSNSSSSPSIQSSIDGIKMVTNTNDAFTTTATSTTTTSKTKNDSKISMEETVETIQSSTTTSSSTSFTERITNSGVASAAAMATAAVNAAVSMKSLEAPSTTKSYISLDTSTTVIDEDGLPLRYDKDAIEQYWKKERGALNKRWGYFVSKAVPFLTRLTTLFIRDGKIDEQYIPELSQQARVDLQDLGPTFIKAGQMMSVRPDVLPQVCVIIVFIIIPISFISSSLCILTFFLLQMTIT